MSESGIRMNLSLRVENQSGLFIEENRIKEGIKPKFLDMVSRISYLETLALLLWQSCTPSSNGYHSSLFLAYYLVHFWFCDNNDVVRLQFFGFLSFNSVLVIWFAIPNSRLLFSSWFLVVVCGSWYNSSCAQWGQFLVLAIRGFLVLIPILVCCCRFLMATENPCVHFSGKNYGALKFQFKMFVKGKGLWGHLDGTSTAPADNTLEAWQIKDA